MLYSLLQQREVVQIVAKFFAAKINANFIKNQSKIETKTNRHRTKINEKSIKNLSKIDKIRTKMQKSAQERPRASQRARKSTFLSSWGRLGPLLGRSWAAPGTPRAVQNAPWRAKMRAQSHFLRIFSHLFSTSLFASILVVQNFATICTETLKIVLPSRRNANFH